MALTDDQLYKLIDNVNSYHRLVSESKGELLLNKYPNAAAAYSLRLLDGYYRGPLVRVRRDGDGAEVDVYADYNNELSLDSLVTNVADIDDTTTSPNENADATFLKGLQSLGEFVHDDAYDSVNAAVTATVCVWYDQANENDAKQVVADNQPTIYTGGALVLENGKVAVAFDGTNDGMKAPYDSTAVDAVSMFAVTAGATKGQIFGSQSLTTGVRVYVDGTRRWEVRGGGTNTYQYLGTDEQAQMTGLFVANSQKMYENGVSKATGVTAYTGYYLNDICIGQRTTDASYTDAKIQEFFFYGTDQSSNRQGIEQDINNHYQIEGYTPPQPLLDEYSGAAAAYSLRKLSSSYSGPLVRVRRSTDNTEVDVYPDDKGAFSVLSTIVDGGDEISNVSGGSTTKTKLYEFVYGQASDLTVVVWYDQSSGDNDATQTTTSRQPKVYDSVTGVVTENGKAALDFDVDWLLMTSTVQLNSDFTILSVNVIKEATSAFVNQITGEGSDSTLQTNPTEQLIRNEARQEINTFTLTVSNDTQSVVLITENQTTDTQTLGINGTTQSLDSFSGGNGFYVAEIGNYRNDAVYARQSPMQELVVWSSNLETNRTGIEKNLNNYYNIF